MSCLGPNYNPVPTREWSRFENNCAYNPIGVNANGLVYVPYLEQYIPESQLGHALAVLKKGNILQYKKNSSNLTKMQKYAQIAKGNWTNRTTTWASQSESVSIPNTKSLRRVNYSNITVINGVPTATTEPITCPPVNPSAPVYPVIPPPNPGGTGQTQPPVIPSPSDVPAVGPVLPPVVPTPSNPPIVIPDGGSLVCNIVENICTGEIYDITSSQNCYPTTDSDVPGPVQYLCYNSALPTYYPRRRYTYSAGGNKWPTNSKFIFSAGN